MHACTPALQGGLGGAGASPPAHVSPPTRRKLADVSKAGKKRRARAEARPSGLGLTLAMRNETVISDALGPRASMSVLERPSICRSEAASGGGEPLSRSSRH